MAALLYFIYSLHCNIYQMSGFTWFKITCISTSIDFETTLAENQPETKSRVRGQSFNLMYNISKKDFPKYTYITTCDQLNCYYIQATVLHLWGREGNN